MAVSKSKNYENMRKYLDRNLNISCASKNSRLFFDKYTKSLKPTDWQSISIKDLQEYGIHFVTFSIWREEMIQKGALICMATKEEMKTKDVNFKAGMFKYGSKIKKYIESELKMSIHEKMDSKADEERVIKLEENVSVLEEKVNTLEGNMNNMATLILKVLPPDTPERRVILDEFKHDPVECMRRLKLDMDKNIKETGHMFN
ncbi:hypothetical protein [Fluviispira vulneris]|uniref:hypothetical protein n=1 Tax=Fluviispira vulneris TaxID=2763012 RepID=UPI0016453E9E|nr:hypothetical protein [Fluviispira vulneris]